MYVTINDLRERYKVDQTTIWRWRKKLNFPEPIMMGENTARWKLEDVEAWEKVRAAA